MLFSLIESRDIRIIVINLLLTIPVILFTLSCHEAAHAYAAYKMGDRTAFNLGRMTINPIKHLDLIGTLCMLVFGFGWAKPVPINARNFRNPKKGMAITGIAGPLANLCLGTIGIFFRYLTAFIQIKFFPESIYTEGFASNLFTIISTLFYLLIQYNFVFMVFNLIPIPPFDGSRFIGMFLPDRIYFKIMQYEKYSFLIVMAINLVLSRVLGIHLTATIAEWAIGVISKPFDLLFNLLLRL